MKIFVLILTALSFAMTAHQASAQSNLDMGPKGPTFTVDPDIKEIFIPQGFDSNDYPEFEVEVELPDNGFHLIYDEPTIDSENGEIGFHLKAVRYPVDLPVITNSHETIRLKSMLPALKDSRSSGYKIKNLVTGQIMGNLPIALSRSNKRDDFSYAIVDTAYLVENRKQNSRFIILKGWHSSECIEFSYDNEFPRIMKTQKNVIEILPVIQKRENCESTRKAKFELPIAIPTDVPAGHYLFHIRRGDGKGYNLVDDLELNGTAATKP